MVNEGMDENTIPVQTPSILQSEQIHFGVDSEREKGTKFSSYRFPWTPFEILQMLF